jgi:hypothetical protein
MNVSQMNIDELITELNFKIFTLRELAESTMSSAEMFLYAMSLLLESVRQCVAKGPVESHETLWLQ